MATKVVFGKLPVNRGAYVSGTTYYKNNIVQHNGSSFMATQDGELLEPIVTYQDGAYTVTTGWVLMSAGGESLIISGASSDRPDGSTVSIGFQYFDTTLGKPIWWNGSNWVDSTGTTIS